MRVTFSLLSNATGVGPCREGPVSPATKQTETRASSRCWLRMTAWINTGPILETFTLTFSLTLCLCFFQVTFAGHSIFGKKAIGVQQDMHVFQSVEENTIGDGPPFLIP